MPELLLKQPRIVADFAKEMSEEIREIISQELIEGKEIAIILARLYPEIEYIGHGSQVFVVGHPRDTEKVVAFNIFDRELFRNPIRSMELYHLHKILYILFPYNFPKFFAVMGGENAQSVREKIKTSSTTTVKYPFLAVIEYCKQIGLPLVIDDSQHNFVKAEDGGEYYLDTVMTPNSSIFFEKFDRSKLLKYMETHGVEVKLEKRIMASLKRLRELDVIGTIRYVLENVEYLTKEGMDLSKNQWLAGLLKSGDYRFDELDQRSIDRIRKFVEFFEVSDEYKDMQEKIIEYLS